MAAFVSCAAVAVLGPAGGMAAHASSNEKIRIEPRYFVGQTLFYRVLMRTSSKNETTTPIVNPEGASSWSESIRMVVRLDVLSLPAAPSQAAGKAGSSKAAGESAEAEADGVRVRATFKQSEATLDSDAVNPAIPAPGSAYKQLASHAIEFTVLPSGQLANISGLDAIHPNAKAQPVSFDWLGGIIARGNLPNRWISMGEKWSDERTLQGMPLTEIHWRADTSYLRDEPCGPEAAAGTPAGSEPAKRDICAIILTKFEIRHEGSPHTDASPQEYIQSGLRTMGNWSGSGDSLESIAIPSGLLVSSTQSSSQDTDYTIASAVTGSKIHVQGHMTTETEITLLPAGEPSS
jgi:hypothetical protein